MNELGQGCGALLGLIITASILMSCFESCTGSGYRSSGLFDGMSTEQANEKKLEMLMNNQNW